MPPPMARPDLGANSGVEVFGLFELRRILIAAEPEAEKAIDAGIAQAAEGIRSDAEILAAGRIRKIGSDWSRMRTGVTGRVVYVAPQKRGVRVRGPHPRRRPNLANLLAERAMQPALEKNQGQIVARVDEALTRLIERANRR